MRKIFKHIIRTIGFLIITPVILLLLALGALQTPFVKSLLVDFAELQAEKVLNGQLHIGKLEGNFINGLRLKQILLTNHSDTLIWIPMLKIEYQLAPLFSGNISIHSLTINRLQVKLMQQKNGRWNFQELIKTPSQPTEKTSPFKMRITLENLQLNNAQIFILSENPSLPEKISDLHLKCNGEYSDKQSKLFMEEFRLTSHQPDLQIKELKFNFVQESEILHLSDFFLRTGNNTLTANSKIDISASETSFLSVKTAPLFLNEFADFFSAPLQENIHPLVHVESIMQDDNLRLTLNLSEKKEKIEINLQVSKITEIIRQPQLTDNVTYTLMANVDQMELNKWINLPEPNILLNGEIFINGKGISLNTMEMGIKGDFGKLKINNQDLHKLNFNFDYASKKLTGQLFAESPFGNLYLQSAIKEPTESIPSYKFLLVTRKLNPSTLFPAMKGSSDLNMKIELEGSGFDPLQMTAYAKIQVDTSSISGWTIHSLQSNLNFQQQNFFIENFSVETASAHLSANGIYSIKGNSDAFLNLTLNNASEIIKFTGVENLNGRGKIAGHFHGTPKKFLTDLNLTLFDTQFQTYSAEEVTAHITAQIPNDRNFSVSGNLNAKNLNLGGIELQSIQLVSNADSKNIQLSSIAESGEFNTSFKSAIHLDNPLLVELSDFRINYRNNSWKQGTDTALFYLSETDYRLEHLKLISEDADTLQTLSAEGKISKNGEQNFQISLSNLDFAKISETFFPEQSLQGKINFNAQLMGEASSPVAEAKFRLNNFALQNYYAGNMTGTLQLTQQQLNTKVNINLPDSGKLSADAKIPVNFRLDSMQFNIPSYENENFDFNLFANKIPLTLLQSFLPDGQYEGIIQTSMHAGGNIKEPELKGKIEITDGKIKMPQYGINYPHFMAGISMDNNKIKIDTFLITSRDGRMNINGNMSPPTFLSKSTNAPSPLANVQIHFANFRPIDHKNYNMAVSGDALLKGNADSLLFSGDINIPQAEINLPSLLQLVGKTSAPQLPEPLLIKELKKMQPEDSLVITLRPRNEESKKEETDFLKKLQGNLRVKIPRNTWIKNQDMRVELSGDVQLMKHKEFFELFGSVEVLRGQYNLLGKVFIIESGTISFQGGEKINPLLNFTAAYNFRDSNRQQKKLLANISGEMMSPEIKFTMDNQQIDEGDALSYILFGAKLDALTSGQRENINQTFDALGLTESLAASGLSSQLTKLLSNTLNVDYIEVKSKGSFESGSLEVGKYLTNKIFINYVRNFGNYQRDENFSEYEIRVEYEILKFLFLQLTTSPVKNGIDIVIKPTKK